ncbi:hypothetical protein [Streptomyces sp. RPT161]|uniref:hypothetical protein n=1 Tax=Streptomyces sp. RPT161 TaxID=3015993 RepID=UPI0022B86F0A|nr:hypothetical protein [Streptomyces sp. RPT161]
MDQLAATHNAQMKGLIAEASVIAAKARRATCIVSAHLISLIWDGSSNFAG